MVQDLVAAEVGDTGFVPGPVHRGPDGAWDGLLEGRLDGVPARWKLACAVRKTLKAVKNKAEQEHRTARRDKATGLLFATSFDARTSHDEAIKKLIAPSMKGAAVWSRGKLDQLLRKHPWVAFHYFGGTQLRPPIVPLRDFREWNPVVGMQPDLEMVGHTAPLQDVKAFLKSDAKILLLVGEGGSGKSRLLREVAQIARRLPRKQRREAWFFTEEAAEAQRAVLEWVPRDRDLVLCLDDAARAGQLARELLGLVRSPKLNAKVAMTARPTDAATVTAMASALGLSVAQVDVPAVSDSEAVAIARAAGSGIDQRRAQKLWRYSGRNLFLFRSVLTSGDGGSRVGSHEAATAVVASRLRHDTDTALSGVPAAVSASSLLFEVAIRAPLVRPHYASLSFDSSDPAQNSTQADRTIEVLLRAGILLQRGRSLRLRSDMESDLFVADMLNLPAIQARISQLASAGELSPRMVGNLVSAGAKGRELLTGILTTWRNNLPTEGKSQLRSIEHMAYVDPDGTKGYIDLRHRLRVSPPLELGQLQTIVSNMARSGNCARAMATTCDAVNRLDDPTKERRTEAAKLVVDATHPRYSRVDSVLEALDHLRSRVCDDHDPGGLLLAEQAIPFWLGGAYSWTEYNGASISMIEVPFPNTDHVRSVRSKMLEIAVSMLSGDRTTRLASLRALRRSWRGGGRTGIDPNLLAQMGKEAGRVLRACTRINAGWDLPSQARLYALAMHIWACNGPGESNALRFLKSQPWTPELSARVFANHHLEWVPDPSVAFSTAPQDERWSWWVDFHSARHEENDPRQLVDILRRKYRTDFQISELLRSLAPDADDEPADFRAADGRIETLVRAWAPGAPAKWRKVCDRLEGCAVHPAVLRAVESERFRSRPDQLAMELRQAARDGDEIRLGQLLGYLWTVPDAIALDLATSLASTGASAVRRAVLDNLSWRKSLPRSAFGRLLTTALQDADWSKDLDVVQRWVVYGDDPVEGREALASAILAQIREMAARDMWESHAATTLAAWAVAALPQGPCAFVESILGTDGWMYAWEDTVLAALRTAKLSLAEMVEQLERWMRAGLLSAPEECACLLGALDQPGTPDQRAAVARSLLQGTGNSPLLGIAIFSAWSPSALGLAALAEASLSAPPDAARAARDRLSANAGPSSYSGTVGETPPAWAAAQARLEEAIALSTNPGAIALLHDELSLCKRTIERLKEDDETFIDGAAD